MEDEAQRVERVAQARVQSGGGGKSKTSRQAANNATTIDGFVASSAQAKEIRARVLASLAKDGIDSVRIVLVDLHGVPRAKLLSAKHFERVITAGHSWPLPLLAANLWEEMTPTETALGVDVGWDNGVLMPDLRSFVKLPWTRSTAHVIADFFRSTGEEMPSPRQVLARILRQAFAAGYEPVFGTELEFYVFKPELGDAGFNAVFGRQSWFSVNALGLAQQFTDALGDAVRRMDLPVYEIFSEKGAGQFEINLEPGSGVGAIDNVVALKIAIKEVAQTLGLRATFLARPTNLWETPTSGYHLHQMLKDLSGDNAFYDPTATDSLSAVCRHYIGGQIAHATGMTAIAAPTVTAYKRYIAGTNAPSGATWAVGNRSALLRALPMGENTHLENRLGSSDANPYLLAAVNVAAGLDGIAKQTDPGEPGHGNMWASVEDRFQRLPTTLIDGVAAYAADAVLVQSLGEDFSRIFTGLLRNDWKRYTEHVTDWEIREYREIL